VADFTAGETPSTAKWNAFANEAREICTSSTRPTSPIDGQPIFETDTRKVRTFHSSTGTWRTDYATDTWDTWTPTLTQSATITATLTFNLWARVGRKATGTASFAATSAGTALNAVQISLPTTAAVAANTPIGTWWYNDNGTGYYSGIVVANTTTTGQLWVAGGTARTASFGVDPAVTIASGDILTVNLDYYGVV
jgi:hypothetical protein